MDFVPNLNEGAILDMLRHDKHIHIATGSGSYEDPSASVLFGEILSAKGIPHLIDVWSNEWTHDWPTWRAMLPVMVRRFAQG
jgi:esterase/lipase superfamily enzyme